ALLVRRGGVAAGEVLVNRSAGLRSRRRCAMRGGGGAPRSAIPPYGPAGAAAAAGPAHPRPGARGLLATPSTAPCCGATASSRSGSRRGRPARAASASTATPRPAGAVRSGRRTARKGRRRARPDRRACPAAPRRRCGEPAPGSRPLLVSPFREFGSFVQHRRELTDLADRHPCRLARRPADDDFAVVDEDRHAAIPADHVAAPDAPHDLTVLHFAHHVAG